MCVKIITGTGVNQDGHLTVKMDGSVAASGYHVAGAIVLQSCVKDLQTLTIQGTSNDAWVGEIVITDDGNPATVACQNCTGDYVIRGGIVVNGNTDSSGQANTQCFVEACSITWNAAGINKYKCPLVSEKKLSHF